MEFEKNCETYSTSKSRITVITKEKQVLVTKNSKELGSNGKLTID